MITVSFNCRVEFLRMQYSLLHRQSTSPRAIALCLVLIRMMNLRFSLQVFLSVVEVGSHAHARPPL